MLSDAQRHQYLQRIDSSEEPKDRKVWLTQLHIAHLRHLPFENLDITFGRKITLSEQSILLKLLDENRGGFCYELNYSFYSLLTSLGFNVELLSAQAKGQNGYGPEFDHLLLLVNIDGYRVLADVGFGDSFVTPVPIDDTVVEDNDTVYKIDHKDGQRHLLRSDKEANWQPQYRFTLVPRTLQDFTDTAAFHQTSPLSTFTQKTTCSVTTAEGRITLSDRKLITTSHGVKTERRVESVNEYKSLLNAHFGVLLPKAFPVEEWFLKRGLFKESVCKQPQV